MCLPKDQDLLIYNISIMTELLSDYIFDKCFTPFGHKVCVRNETSHTLFTKSDTIIIKELKDDGLSMDLPLNICQKGHSLTLFFLSLDNENKITLPNSGHLKEALFEVIGKVEELETNKVAKDTVCILLHFTQYDQVAWKKILQLYSKNQDEINNILMSQRDKRGSE